MKGFLKSCAVGLVIVGLLVAMMVLFGGPVPRAEAQLMGFATGTVTSTTSATINVPIGFIPRSVVVTRVTATASNTTQVYWNKLMGNGYCMLSTSSTNTYTTSNCIGTYSGSTTTAPGFYIGTNSSINPGTDVLIWEATQ